MITSTYTVTGMTCGHCAAHITEEVEQLSGVHSVAVDHQTGLMRVESAAPLDPALIDQAVKEAGNYQVAEA